MGKDHPRGVASSVKLVAVERVVECVLDANEHRVDQRAQRGEIICRPLLVVASIRRCGKRWGEQHLAREVCFDECGIGNQTLVARSERLR